MSSVDPAAAERSGEIALPEPLPAVYSTEQELTESLARKGTADPGDGLYPRDGNKLVKKIEGLVSEVTLGSQINNVVLTSGMSVVREACIFASAKKGAEGTRGGGFPVIARGRELYSQSIAFFNKEKDRGIAIAPFDSGDPERISHVIEDKEADVVFAETVANAPAIPVMDIPALLEAVRSMDDPPIVILDHTLPLSTGLDMDRLLQPDDPVLIVESGTKNLMNNSEVLGLVYSPNLDLIEEFRRHKAHSGAVNSIGALLSIVDSLERGIPGFHERNQRVFSSTGSLALALAEAQVEMGASADFVTTYPTDPLHPNHHLAGSFDSEDFPSPVVFLQSTHLRSDGSSLLARIISHPALREFIEEGEIGSGQSFGTPKVRILYDKGTPNVRFVGGYDLSDEQRLVAAVKEAAADK